MNHAPVGESLFSTEDAADRFVINLGKIATERPVVVHAYCAMGNHYHLLVRTTESELRRAIRFLEAELTEEIGAPRVLPLEVGRHLLGVTRYIHRNPVEAGLVDRPEEWRWSSYRGYLDYWEGPFWLRSSAVLGWLGCLAPRALYRRYVDD